jgi:Tol biopolymer transport system component
VAALALVAGMAAPSPLATSSAKAELSSGGASSLIAFEHYDASGATTGIDVMNSDGSGVRQVPLPPSLAQGIGGMSDGGDITWSPNGKQLAFAVYSENGNALSVDARIYVINVDGSGLRELVANGWDPAWSPDGRQIAFVTGDFLGRKALALDVINLDGSGKRTLLTGSLAEPTWSPDGSRIAFSMSRVSNTNKAGWSRIWIVGTHGTGVRPLPGDEAPNAWDEFPAWSPDGTRIAMERSVAVRNPHWICVQKLTDTHCATVDDGVDGSFSWSPDGRSFVYVDSDGNIASIGADGRHHRFLNMDGFAPVWSPRLNAAR